MTGRQLRKEHTQLVMDSEFTAGMCPRGCVSTFSDLNINTVLVYYCVTDDEWHDPLIHQKLWT